MQEQLAADLSEEARLARQFVAAWLGRDDWKLSEWVDDFSGVNLPPLPPEEPYVWILEGLGNDAGRPKRSATLARRLAEVLEARPDTGDLDLDRQQALYNVLVLGSEIRDLPVLARPLKNMLDRASLPDIKGRYSLRFALRQALMMNPPGRELESLWVAMAQGETHPFLPSDPYDAFHGVLLLPPDKKKEYAADGMSKVLKTLAIRLERDDVNEETRDNRFSALLDRVVQCWGSDQYLVRFFWDSYLDPWPAWAFACVVEKFLTDENMIREIRIIRKAFDQHLASGTAVSEREALMYAGKASVQLTRSLRIFDPAKAEQVRFWHRKRLLGQVPLAA